MNTFEIVCYFHTVRGDYEKSIFLVGAYTKRQVKANASKEVKKRFGERSTECYDYEVKWRRRSNRPCDSSSFVL